MATSTVVVVDDTTLEDPMKATVLPPPLPGLVAPPKEPAAEPWRSPANPPPPLPALAVTVETTAPPSVGNNMHANVMLSLTLKFEYLLKK